MTMIYSFQDFAYCLCETDIYVCKTLRKGEKFIPTVYHTCVPKAKTWCTCATKIWLTHFGIQEHFKPCV